MRFTRPFALAFICAAAVFSSAQTKRKIIIDQDGAGPGGTDQTAILLLIQSPQTDVLGMTMVTGDSWLKEEVAHTQRTLEIIGRTDIPVVPGAEYPLIRRKAETELWEKRYGSFTWLGAWTPGRYHPADQLGEFPEGMPTTKPANEDAAHFLIRVVRRYPHEVTIYEGGPMTNLALAIAIDPEFPSLAKELVFMGGSLNPPTNDPEFANTPRHEFNLWFDPEAAHIVLTAPWRKIVCTTVDLSLKTQLTAEMLNKLKNTDAPAAKYVGTYTKLRGFDYLWDEMAAIAWLEPSVITKKESRYMDVDLDRGAGYGNTLTWSEKDKPSVALQQVEIQDDYDREKFYRLFIDLLSSPAPQK